MIALAVACLVQLVIGSGVLAGALLVTGEEALTKETLLKCLGITLIALLIGLIPVLGLFSFVIWLGALMAVFEKDFLEALIIAIVCAVINFVIGFGLLALAGAMGLVG
ncbi:MAG: hypothetical protein KDB22_28900 [Planctomycetales bacterium]|nr:hypothetical protein [Planctomycetales bacterium]